MVKINTTEWNPSNERIAALTGLPLLTNIKGQPLRLGRLVHAARAKMAGYHRTVPLRYKVAAKIYAERAEAMIP